MRKTVALFAFFLSAALVFGGPPATAFGLRIGPFHIGLPFGWHHRHHHSLYMRASSNEPTRSSETARASETARSSEMARASETARTSEPASSDTADAAPEAVVSPALVYPNLALPVIFENVFWPNNAQWPFGYQSIFTTAFAKLSEDQDQQQCQQPLDANALIGRISRDISPTAEQMPLLQKLGGALGMASGYLARACPKEIPAQPVARLQMMQTQIQALAMAVDIVHQPLQDFEQTLTPNQRLRFRAAPSPRRGVREQNQAGALVRTCGGSSAAIDWSIEEINESVQPTDAQRDDLLSVKQAFAGAAADLDTHCRASVPATALGRLETIEARLDAAWRTVLSMQVTLADFEGKLSDEQKSRFDAMNIATR